MQITLKDLQSIIHGAMKRGIKTVCEFMAVCKANNLNTNADKLHYFAQ